MMKTREEGRDEYGEMKYGWMIHLALQVTVAQRNGRRRRTQRNGRKRTHGTQRGALRTHAHFFFSAYSHKVFFLFVGIYLNIFINTIFSVV